MSLDRLRLGPVAQLLGLLALGSRGTAWFAPYIFQLSRVFFCFLGSTSAIGQRFFFFKLRLVSPLMGARQIVLVVCSAVMVIVIVGFICRAVGGSGD